MNTPDKLYHYTSAAGLLGMMNGEIWTSQIQYMNDHKEWEHAMDIARSTITKLQRSHDSKLVFIADNLLMNVGEKQTMSRTFVFSLTEEPDLLSQWRGYCPEGGYCIGFNMDKLTAEPSFRGLQLKQCVYLDEQKERIVNDIVNRYVKDYYDIEISETYRKKLINDSIQEFRDLAAYFKHSTFAEEKEWRLVGSIVVTDEKSSWRVSGNLPIPYCKHNVDFYNLATEIIVGPKVNYRLAEHSISFKGYGKRLSIRRSSSTLV